jgi:hypothetical protein
MSGAASGLAQFEFGVFSVQVVGGFEASDTKPFFAFWIPL